jgi:hypothetical protein
MTPRSIVFPAMGRGFFLRKIPDSRQGRLIQSARCGGIQPSQSCTSEDVTRYRFKPARGGPGFSLLGRVSAKHRDRRGRQLVERIFRS